MPEEQSEGPWRLPCGHEVLKKDQTHYCSYIDLRVIIRRMAACEAVLRENPTGQGIHRDEVQFIVVHQSCEQLFELHIFELRGVIAEIQAGNYARATMLLNRVLRIINLYRSTMSLLNTMEPTDFMAFRRKLAPASGAESIAFRKIELLSGLREDSPYVKERGVKYCYREWLDRAPGMGENDPKTRWWTDELTFVAREPSLASTFDEALRQHGITSIADLFARKNISDLQSLALKLHFYEKTFLAFRTSHASRRSANKGAAGRASDRARGESGHTQVAEAQIGGKRGTGHTSGVPYLKTVAHTARFFPELWRYMKDR